MGTLGTLFGGAYLAMRGGGDKSKQNGDKAQPTIQASSKEEEAFISYVTLYDGEQAQLPKAADY